jgi:AraC family transcriptional activator of pobA
MRQIKTISEFHKLRQLPAPQHPLISVIDVATIKQLQRDEPRSLLLDFYLIAIKRISNFKVRYGQKHYDFDEGIMYFMSPGQVYSICSGDDGVLEQSGWMLLIHPDFLWNTHLPGAIKRQDFWGYSVNEALFLSEKEEAVIHTIIKHIRQEYHANIDAFSKQIILSHIESILHYADRFYNRQFITREKVHHEILGRLEEVLQHYFESEDVSSRGLPTVQYVAGRLNISPKYLSSLLRIHTGRNTQQHIHDALLAKAKEKLTTTSLSVGEIAYSLGFEHLPSFSKLFKAKTNVSPVRFRESFG